MTILQFIWQIILICGLLIGLAVGLFSSPWYVLGGILVVAFVVTWRLMPTQETYLSQFVDTFNELQQNHSSSDQAETSIATAQSSGRSPQQSDSTTAAQPGSAPAVLSYRGAAYSVQTAPEVTLEEKTESILELKYRGAKIKLNQPQ